MQAQGGKAWLIAAFLLVFIIFTPLSGWAGGSFFWQDSGWRSPVILAGAQSSMEAQMLDEKAPAPSRPGAAFLPNVTPSLQLGQDGTTIRLPYNLEMNISVRYSRDPSAREPQRLSDSPLLMKYSMDYRLLPNLQVGLNSYLYRPAEEGLPLPYRSGDRLGFGPQLKYDLGNWSFLLKSQVESGNREQGHDLQNWFRVWYAF
jgi:hypothetical protein